MAAAAVGLAVLAATLAATTTAQYDVGGEQGQRQAHHLELKRWIVMICHRVGRKHQRPRGEHNRNARVRPWREIGGQDGYRVTQMGLAEPIDTKIVDRSKFQPQAQMSHVFSPRCYSTVICVAWW